jgi:putative transposase
MIKAYKYELDLNNVQKTFFNKSFGSCRYIYNWALQKKTEAYQNDKTKLTAFDLSKQLTELKKQENVKWLNEVNSQSLQQSIRNLETAFTKFFREKKGFPNFKKKSGKQSCKFTASVHVDFESSKIKLPNIGWVRAYIDRKFEGKIGTVTVSKISCGKYFISILIDNNIPFLKKVPIKEKTAVGLDVGIKSFVTLSTGEKIENPKYLENSQKRLACLQRRLARKVKGSHQREKTKLAVAKIYYKISCQRTDFLHKLSSNIVKNHDSIIIEDLNIAGMLKNHCLARSISSASWYEFFNQLRYKCDWYGKNLITIGRWEASSKTCSCGVVNSELTLKDRTWTCKSCGVTHDRDFLASCNIKKFGLVKQNLLKENTCGERDKHVELSAVVGAVKREVIKVSNYR